MGRYVRVGLRAPTYYPGQLGGTFQWGPVEDIRREALVERLVARRRAPGEDSDASGCAGAPSNFIQPTTARTTIRVDWPSTPSEEQEPAADVHTAVWWELEDVRVENPDDPEQHVNIKRIKQGRYRRPNGSEYQQDYRPILAAISAS